VLHQSKEAGEDEEKALFRFVFETGPFTISILISLIPS